MNSRRISVHERPSLLRRVAISTLAAAMTVVAFPLTTANGAPVGSPVSVVRSISLNGSGTTGLHYKNGVIWAIQYHSSSVERINAASGALIGSPINVGANPVSPIEVNGHLFVPSAGSNSITDIDMATATVTRTITLSGSNISSLNYDGTNIWATSFGNAIVQRFNPSTGAIVGSSLPVGSMPGTAIAVNGHLFVSASGSNTVTDIDMTTATVTRTITLSGSNISALAFDGTNLWASVFNNAQVARINPTTGNVLGYSATGYNPTNIIYANGSIWVGNTGTDTVTQINPSTGAVIRNISQGGGNISSLTFDGDVIWATNYNNNYVSMIDTTNGTVSATKPSVGAQPIITLIIENNVWIGAANSNVLTQISGPTPTTTTTTTALAPSTTTSTSTTSTTVSPPTSVVSTGSTTTTSNVMRSDSQNEVPTDSNTQSPVQPRTSQSTTTSSTTTTTSIPMVANVESGSAAILVDGVESSATVSRIDDQLIVAAAGIEMKVWGVTPEGNITSLDTDGNLRLTEGDQVEMSVTGLKASADVEVWMFSTPTKLGVVSSTSTGTATGRFTIPTGTESGDHRFAVEARLPNNEKATVAIGIVYGKADTTSTTTRVLIALPILFAVAVGLIVPTTVQRRRRRKAISI